MDIHALMLIHGLLKKEQAEATSFSYEIGEKRRKWEREHNENGWTKKPPELEELITAANDRLVLANHALLEFEEHDWN